MATKNPPYLWHPTEEFRSVVRAIIAFITLLLTPLWAQAFDLVPTDEDIKKYRQSWNPLSEGPLLMQAVDTHPKGQLTVRPFVFSQITEDSYGNRLSFPTDRRDGPVHLYSVLAPLVAVAYGLTDHVELGVGTSLNAWWANSSESFNRGQGGPWTTNTGMGDVTLFVKYRPIVQDPDTWRVSVVPVTQIVLPTSRWTGTERPPGGFAPLGRLPATRFGEFGLTQGLMLRKNIEPFRFTAGVFYTHQLPGTDEGRTTYVGDVINTRFAFEHFLDDERGLAYNIEIATLHTATWRADGRTVNRGMLSGSTIVGIEPAIQYRFTDSIVGAVGVLFTVAGQNAPDAIYPNVGLHWYWHQGKKPIMR